MKGKIELSYNAIDKRLTIYVSREAHEQIKSLFGFIVTYSKGRVFLRWASAHEPNIKGSVSKLTGLLSLTKYIEIDSQSFGKTPVEVIEEGISQTEELIINWPSPDMTRPLRNYPEPRKAPVKTMKREVALKTAMEALNALVDNDIELFIKDGKVKARILTFVEI